MLDQAKRWSIVTEIFAAALEQPAELQADQVQGCLERYGLSDQDLREIAAEVEQLLSAHEGPPLGMELGLAGSEDGDPVLPARIGAYRVIRRLAQGGMGDVLLAERADHTFERQVAIKTLGNRPPTSGWIERFHREQAIHAQMQHPNIAQVLDAGVSEPEGTPYLVMEYVAGATVLGYVQAAAPTIRQRIILFIQICDAVAFAHNHLVLHRDIKPSNILVTDAGQAKLLDFGIAKLLDDQSAVGATLTQTGQRLMTPRYASPEQIRGEPLAVTSDIYSLGVVLYELLTGQPPFVADSDFELSKQILNQDAKPPNRADRTIGGTVPIDLQAICLKALEKKPSGRYSNAAAMADDLRRYLRHQTITARRPSWLERARRLLRRHPVAIPLGALAVAATISAAGVAAWQANQAAQERDLARSEQKHAEQVTEVLIDLFDRDPFAETQDRLDTITLREFLLSRAKRIGSEFEDRPALQARLLHLFANLLNNMSLLDEAEPYAEQAASILRQLHADQPTEQLATSLNVLATLRQQQARFAESEALFREVLAIREQLYGEQHVLVAESVSNLGGLLNYWDDDSRNDEQVALAERALKISVAVSGPDSLEAAMHYNGLGASYLERDQPGDIDRALELLGKTLVIRRRELGDSHPSTGTVSSNLANILHDAGRLEEADKLFREALFSVRAGVGDRHPRVADVLYGHGHLLLDLERPNDAVEAFRESLDICEETLPAAHPYIGDTGFALGKALIAANQTSAAIEVLRSATAALQEHDHLKQTKLAAQYHLARALRASGQHDTAIQTAEQTLAELQTVKGSGELLAELQALIAELTTQ